MSKILGSISIFVFARILGVTLTFALLPFVARYLSSEAIGAVFMFQSIALIASSFVAIGNTSVIKGLYYQIDDKTLSVYIASSLTNSLIMWFVKFN